MRDPLVEAKTSIENYSHALSLGNGHSAFAQRLHIEQNCVTWLDGMIAECAAHREFGITAATAAALAAAPLPEAPLYPVYVCSPCRGNVRKNIAAARGYCSYVISEGFIPIAPHVMFSGILEDDNPDERAAGMRMGKEMLRYCRELWIFGSRVSEGMRAEIELAKYLKIPVRRIDEECLHTQRIQTCPVRFQGWKSSGL